MTKTPTVEVPGSRRVRPWTGSRVAPWLVVIAGSAQAQIYMGSDPAGSNTLILSNHASSATPTLLIQPDPVPAGDAMALPTIPSADTLAPRRGLAPTTASLIRRMAIEYAVAEPLIKAVIAVESGFDPRARSPKGAMGLMQLMPDTARRFGVQDAYSEEQNLRAGTAYLRWLLDTFAGDVSLALAAYNAGEAAVLRAGRRIPNIAETRAYVPKVLAHQARYYSESQRRSR